MQRKKKVTSCLKSFMKQKLLKFCGFREEMFKSLLYTKRLLVPIAVYILV